jgi:Flp pilus assembly protein TadD
MQEGAPPGAELDPADVHRQMGIAAQKLRRSAEAVRHYEECLRLNPDDPQREAIRATIRELR